MRPAVDEALVAHLAELARLELPAEERAALAADLEKILSYVDVLAEAPGAEIDGGLEEELQLLRPDEPAPSLPREVALREAPRSNEEGFMVPAFVDEG